MYVMYTLINVQDQRRSQDYIKLKRRVNIGFLYKL